MHLIIGLGPIGGNIGARLAELGRKVYGNDFNADRVREWSGETNSPAGSDLSAVEWSSVESIHIAVRVANQVASVFESLRGQARSRWRSSSTPRSRRKTHGKSSRRLPARGARSRPPCRAARRARVRAR